MFLLDGISLTHGGLQIISSQILHFLNPAMTTTSRLQKVCVASIGTSGVGISTPARKTVVLFFFACGTADPLSVESNDQFLICRLFAHGPRSCITRSCQTTQFHRLGRVPAMLRAALQRRKLSRPLQGNHCRLTWKQIECGFWDSSQPTAKRLLGDAERNPRTLALTQMH